MTGRAGLIPARRRRTWWLAALVVVPLGCGTGSGPVAVEGDDRARAADTTGASWRELPPPPVSPRTGSTTAWTGTEALFLGGTTGRLCPPAASCVAPAETARDGAAFDPATSTWRPLAPAPVDLPGYGSAPVVGDQAFLLLSGELLGYDASDDRWSRLPGPPGPADGSWVLQQGDGTVVALRTEQRSRYTADQQYDPATSRWQALPKDPLVPSFAREVLATPHGLLLTAKPEVDQPGSDLETSLTRAALLVDGAWTRLPDTGQLGGGFTWTGRRAVAPALGGADGGQVNGYGRTVPFGGVLELPAGRWTELDSAPAEQTGGYPVHAVAGGRVAVDGWLYDDVARSWTRLPRPEGAPVQPGSAVWAGDRLVLLGGYTPDDRFTDAGLSARAFAYRP